VASRFFGKLSDRHGRMWPIRVGLAAATVLAIAMPLPAEVLLVALGVVAIVCALAFLWAPAMALLSDSAEATGLEQGFAFALVNLAWAGGQVLGGSSGAAIAEASGDWLPYAIVAALFAATFATLTVTRPRSAAEPAPAVVDGTR
jgi:MFS family permease